ncbi:MAG: hypothetical protein NBV67_12065 [Tagaea sp.]|nr:hypothetical protein [Tagaea sp.]
MRLGTLAIFAAAVLAACAPHVPGPAGVPQMGVRTYFGVEHLCSLGVSPPILIDGAPANAARYRVRFTNTSVLRAEAPQFEAPAGARGLEQGALDGYRGPCPGEQAGFNFRVEVLALDTGGRAVGYGNTTAVALNPSRFIRGPAADRPRMPPGPGEPVR